MNFNEIAAFLGADAVGRGFSLPPLAAVEQLLEYAFYASLAQEEGVGVRCDLLIIDPQNPDPIRPQRVTESRWQCVPLDQPVSLTVSNLAKIAAAVDPWATALAVYYATDDWFVWGVVDQQTHYNRWRHLDAESGPHNPQTYRIAIEDVAYLAVYWDYNVLLRSIRGDIFVAPAPVFKVGQVSARVDDIIRPFTTALIERVGMEIYERHSFWPIAMRREFRNAIQRILLHIVRYRHGGALLISSESGQDLKPKYALNYERLGRAVLRHLEALMMWRESFDKLLSEAPISIDTYNAYHNFNVRREETAGEISGCVHTIASFARVDGLVWLSDALAVRGFGVEIRSALDPKIVVACGNAGGSEAMKERREPAIFGMRHRSMMRYCYAHKGALGFVVSQDGPVRAMLRDGDELLLWEDIRLRD